MKKSTLEVVPAGQCAPVDVIRSAVKPPPPKTVVLRAMARAIVEERKKAIEGAQKILAEAEDELKKQALSYAIEHAADLLKAVGVNEGIPKYYEPCMRVDNAQFATPHVSLKLACTKEAINAWKSAVAASNKANQCTDEDFVYGELLRRSKDGADKVVDQLLGDEDMKERLLKAGKALIEKVTKKEDAASIGV